MRHWEDEHWGIVEDDDFLNEEQKELIDNLLDNEYDFPYFFHPHSVEPGDECSALTHVFLDRPEFHEGSDEERWRSTWSMDFVGMAESLLNKYGLSSDGYIRGCVNLTHSSKKERTLSHFDHDVPHHQLLIYCNDPDDTDCATVIERNGEEIKIKPKKYKAVLFPSEKHYMIFPKTGERLIIVFTLFLR